MGTLSQETINDVKHTDIEHQRNQPINIVDYIKEKIPYEDFFFNYLLPNRPCVFGRHVTKQWKSVEKWVTWEGKPNLEYLAARFGKLLHCIEKQF